MILLKRFKMILLFSVVVLTLSACIAEKPKDPEYDRRSLVTEECSYLNNIGDWQPVWCDEFDVDGAPDPTRWGYDIGGGGWGNQELQFYTNRLDNAFVEDGILHIRALREDYMGRNYTSARLVSKWRGDWLYGRIVVKARVPEGRGTWPAIWMLPTDWEYGNWPYSGEIDIMEHVGYDSNVIHGTIHTGAYNHMKGTQIGNKINIPSATNSFHIYEMIWEPGKIELFIDGVRFAIFGFNPNTTIDINNSDAWPFDQRFHLIMNLAIGGTWGGVMGVDENAFPAALEIEYVRVYQKDYAGMDQEPPTSPTDLTLQQITYNSARFRWTHATDDVLIRHYNIYVDGDLVDTTSLNAIRVYGLSPETTHIIEVEAEDFKGNRSTKEMLEITTEPVRTIDTRIDATEYDAMNGVQTEPTSDEGGGYNVGWISPGDWLEYIVRVNTSGTYRIDFRVASLNGGTFRVHDMAKPATPLATVEVLATGGWQSWVNVESDTFYLEEGVYTIRINATQGGFNLNYFDFEKVE